ALSAGGNQSRFWLTSMRCSQPSAYDRRPVDSDNGFGCFGATLGRLIRVFRSNKGREATAEQIGVCSDEQTCWFTSESEFKNQIQFIALGEGPGVKVVWLSAAAATG